MQQIERYGVIALLFMIVTFVTVSLWDGGEEEPVEAAAATAQPTAPVVHRQQPERKRSDAILTQLPEGDRQPPRKKVPIGGERAEPQLDPTRLDDAGHTSHETSVALNTTREPGGIRSEDPRWESGSPASTAGEELGAGDRRARETLELVKRTLPVPEVETHATTTREYVVKSGDTLERIARVELGDARRWREIQTLNGGIDPRRLMVGQRLELAGEPGPPASVSPGPKTSAPPAKKVATTTYTVKSGDMLGKIAQRELGSAKLWPKIVELNPGVDPNRLLVGAVLLLPRTERSAAPQRELVAKADNPRATRPRVR